MKLVIADRNPKERTGLEWLASSLSAPPRLIRQVASFSELMEKLEQEVPDLLCVELELIPPAQWDRFRHRVNHHRCWVVAMTAESTFEQASRAIQLRSAELWLKPLVAEQVQKSLRSLLHRIKEDSPSPKSAALPAPLGNLSLSLFIDDEQPFRGSMLILQTEAAYLKELMDFLRSFPFSVPGIPQFQALPDAVLCLFPPFSGDEADLFRREGQRILTRWTEGGHRPLFMAAHLSQPAGPSLYQRYHAAYGALSLRFFMGDQQLVLVDRPIQWRTIDPFLSPLEQRDWMERLDRGDIQAIEEWLRTDMAIGEVPYPEPGLLRTRLTSILAQLRRFMRSHLLHKQPHLEAAYHQVFSSILYSPVLYRIINDLARLADRLMEASFENRRRGRGNILEQGIRYMEEHYHRPDLGLEEVAKHVQRNPSYLSHLFAVNGTPFQRHLTQIRLREACRLLESTPFPIQEVARRVGYPNANYFSRVFRSHQKCSPRDYRDKNSDSIQKK
ncbi:DNA-binding response regulator [Desmospora profundinema]|uniref:AraC-like DNA-binding protein/DNA-binding response OmpR family regulator n=1 Tax=Desmospora profundinema TaxID=1571184 RepID=A0ABU1IH72_9BACL|nr:DNA-binding response regulator [Desmospora profundinema]MDR6224128.1 AraC-like DNA-binding protein/DNA-binding response OmpR family regulator [Desmospora profundinema]